MVAPGQSQERVSPVLIGRAEALELGRRRWRGAQDGAGQLLLIAGEAGIGKTRLLTELAADVGDSALPRAAAFPRDTDAPGTVLLNLSDELRRVGMTEPAARLRDRLLGELEGTGDAARRHRILLGDLSEIVIDLLNDEPRMLRIEDLHWSDSLSLDVLDRVAAALPFTRSLIVASYRTDDLGPGTPLRAWRARLLGQRLAEEARLPRLDREDTAKLAEIIMGTVPSAQFVDSLQLRSDGIPLHVEELIAAGSDSAVLESVAEAVNANVALLDAGTRSVVAAASVIGRAFDVGLLESITSVSTDDIDGALREATGHHIVIEKPAGAGFGFRHSIICDAIYDDIPSGRRAALHTAVAQAADVAGFGDAYVSEHYERGGDLGNAHRHALLAAAHAVRVSAHREAAELYGRALRTMPPETNPREQARLHAAIAAELTAIDDVTGAADHLDTAITLYRSLGDEIAAAAIVPQLMAAHHLLGRLLDDRTALAVDALSRVGDAPLPLRATLLAELSAAYMLDRRLDESRDFAQQALALASEPESLAIRIDIRSTLGSVLVFAGEDGWPMLEESIRDAEGAGLEMEAARGYRMLGSTASVVLEYDRATAWLTEGLGVTSRTERWNHHHYLAAHLAHVEWATGDWTAAERLAKQALADGHGLTTRITALHVLGYLALGRGRLDEARRYLDEARELGEGMQELQRFSPALWGLAEVALHEDDPGLAIDLCELGLSASERVMDAAYLFPFVVTGTRAHLAQQNTAAARDWIVRSAVPVRLRNLPGTHAALDHAAGLVKLAEGRTGEARELLESARAGWTRVNRFWEGTQVLVVLARCAHRSRRPAEAARLTAQALEAATSAGSALLESLVRAVPTPDPATTGVLSARELEVARLVAAGATNREIAAALVIAPKTASSHVEHILAKLGVARRAEIAAWVASSGETTPPRH